MSASYKQITFDIDTKVAKQIAGHTDTGHPDEYADYYKAHDINDRRNAFQL